jgi:hypothetical protein
MTTYLRINRIDDLCDELFNIHPNHPYLHKQHPSSEFWDTHKIISRSEYDDYRKTHGISIDGFFKNLTNYKGLIDFNKPLLRGSNGCRFDRNTKEIVTFQPNCKNNNKIKFLYDIFPIVYSLEPNIECDTMFINPSIIWDQFTEEEWEKFINTCIKHRIFIDTKVNIIHNT